MKKEATPKNAKGLIKKTFDEKSGNPKKCKGTRQKRLLIKKEATPKNIKVLIKKTSDEKEAISEKCKAAHQKYL
jgi:hypothetical protein